MPETKHSWLVQVVEEDSASVEVDGRSITPLPRWILPAAAKEGDVLSVIHLREATESSLLIRVDAEAKRELIRRANDRSV